MEFWHVVSGVPTKLRLVVTIRFLLLLRWVQIIASYEKKWQKSRLCFKLKEIKKKQNDETRNPIFLCHKYRNQDTLSSNMATSNLGWHFKRKHVGEQDEYQRLIHRNYVGSTQKELKLAGFACGQPPQSAPFMQDTIRRIHALHKSWGPGIQGSSAEYPTLRMVLGVHTLKNKLDAKFQDTKSKLIEGVQAVEHVAAIADLWTVIKRSYLGIITHW